MLQVSYPDAGAWSRFHVDRRWVRRAASGSVEQLEVRPRLGPSGDRLTEAALARLCAALDTVPDATLGTRVDGGLTGEEVVPPGRKARPEAIVFSFWRSRGAVSVTVDLTRTQQAGDREREPPPPAASGQPRPPPTSPPARR